MGLHLHCAYSNSLTLAWMNWAKMVRLNKLAMLGCYMLKQYIVLPLCT